MKDIRTPAPSRETEGRESTAVLNFAEYIKLLMETKQLRRADVIRDSDLDKAYVYQIFKGEKRASRNKLLAIAFGMHLDVEETQRMLRLGRQNELSHGEARDALILQGIHRGMSVTQVGELLDDHGFSTLFPEDK